jgi:hypothetical protein
MSMRADRVLLNLKFFNEYKKVKCFFNYFGSFG